MEALLSIIYIAGLPRRPSIEIAAAVSFTATVDNGSNTKTLTVLYIILYKLPPAIVMYFLQTFVTTCV